MITLIVPFEAEADATGRRRQCKPSGFVKIRGSGGRGCAVRAWSNDYPDHTFRGFRDGGGGNGAASSV